MEEEIAELDMEPPKSAWMRRSQTIHNQVGALVNLVPRLTYRPKPLFSADSVCGRTLSPSSTMSTVYPAAYFSREISNCNSPPSKASLRTSGNSPVSCSSPSGGKHSATSSPFGFGSTSSGSSSFSSRNAPKELIMSSSVAAVGNTNDSTNDGKEQHVRRVASWTEFLDNSVDVHVGHRMDDYKVDMSQLLIGEKFACGKYSRLYHGMYMGREVALKIVKQPDEDEVVADKLERQFAQEVSVLSHLHHRNIVEFIGAVRKLPVFFIVTEYLPGGSLKSFLHKPDSRPLSLNSLLTLALDIARGMEYLHSQGVLHLDLKSANLVLTADGRVKVTDFGVARNQTECESMTRDCGTYRWMAPEMISNKITSAKADVYSFGIVMWEMCTGGDVPFGDKSAIQAAFAVIDKCERPIIPPTCPRELGELMEQCWAQDPEKRPNFWQVVQTLERLQEAAKLTSSLRCRGTECEKKKWFCRLVKGLRRIGVAL